MSHYNKGQESVQEPKYNKSKNTLDWNHLLVPDLSSETEEYQEIQNTLQGLLKPNSDNNQYPVSLTLALISGMEGMMGKGSISEPQNVGIRECLSKKAASSNYIPNEGRTEDPHHHL